MTIPQLLKLFSDRITVQSETGCWIWRNLRSDRSPYGAFTIAGKCKPAYQWFYQLAGRELQPGHELHHICRVKACVNPDHLESVTRSRHQRLHGKGAPRGGYPRIPIPSYVPIETNDLNQLIARHALKRSA